MSSAVTIDQAPPPRVSSQDKLLALVQAKYPEYHPVVAMADLAHEMRTTPGGGDASIELACHKEIAKYVVAVDRFVEVKQEIKQTKRVVVELFGGPDQPRAIANEPSEVLEVTDVTAKPVVASKAEAREQTVTQSVRTTGSVESWEEPEERSQHGELVARLASAWAPAEGGGKSEAERFT